MNTSQASILAPLTTQARFLTFSIRSPESLAETLQQLNENIELENPVTDGKKSVIGKAMVVKKERIQVPGGSFDTYLVEPDLKDLGGVFRKSKNAKLEVWVTSDARHIPVKIKSKVIVGSFVAELISEVENN